MDDAAPRPTRPRSWCSCARPKRSACSITMTVAFGTSTPTSMTVVETSTWISPREKAPIASSFSALFIRPWSRPTRTPGRAAAHSRRGLGRRLHVLELLRLLDERVDDVGLPPLARPPASRASSTSRRSRGRAQQRCGSACGPGGFSSTTDTSRSP